MLQDHETYVNAQAPVMLLSTSTSPTNQNGIYKIFHHPGTHLPGKSNGRNLHFGYYHPLAGISVLPSQQI
jgi:hypothetical protein